MSWGFRQLAGFIHNKAERTAFPSCFLNEANTSTKCPRYHLTAKANRNRNYRRLLCNQYGIQLNADLAARRAIATHGLEQFRLSQSV
ncbi:MAG: zinc ribbon domain-containing protein [Bacilli bacterium]